MSEAAPHPQGVIPSINLPKRLEIAREHRGMTQAELGDVLGIGRTAVGKCEQGRRQPSRAEVIAWALATGVRFDWLAGADFPVVSRQAAGEGATLIWERAAS
jgi:transcriptional regulator with XRE-family HTH domain